MSQPIGLLRVDGMHGVRFIEVSRVRYIGQNIDAQTYGPSFVMLDGGDRIACRDDVEAIAKKYVEMIGCKPRRDGE